MKKNTAILAKYEGIVDNIDGDIIHSRVIDYSNINDESLMKFKCGLFSKSDQLHVIIGSIFTITVGYKVKPNGKEVYFTKVKLSKKTNKPISDPIDYTKLFEKFITQV